jgi:hypothetical protein
MPSTCAGKQICLHKTSDVSNLPLLAHREVILVMVVVCFSNTNVFDNPLMNYISIAEKPLLAIRSVSYNVITSQKIIWHLYVIVATWKYAMFVCEK